MRKVLTLSAVILVAGCILTFIFFGLINNHFLKSKPISLLPLEKEELGTDDNASPSQEYDSFHIEEAELSLVNKQNKLSWELVMKTMIEDEEGYFLSDIRGKYFPVQGEAFQVKAEKGRMTKDFSNLHLFGHIAITRSDINLTAKEAHWSSQSEKIQLEKEVLLKRDGVVIEADLMLADSDLEQVEIRGNSKWRFAE